MSGEKLCLIVTGPIGEWTSDAERYLKGQEEVVSGVDCATVDRNTLLAFGHQDFYDNEMVRAAVSRHGEAFILRADAIGTCPDLTKVVRGLRGNYKEAKVDIYVSGNGDSRKCSQG